MEREKISDLSELRRMISSDFASPVLAFIFIGLIVVVILKFARYCRFLVAFNSKLHGVRNVLRPRVKSGDESEALKSVKVPVFSVKKDTVISISEDVF